MIRIRKGDTVQIAIALQNNGEPFIPQGETVVFSVGDGKNPPLISKSAHDNAVFLTHEETNALAVGMYLYDVRVYDQSKALVATPCYGNFQILGVVNHAI